MSPSNLTVEVWPITDKGQAPEQNEDFVLVHQPTDPQQARYSGSLYVVADGMGGGMRGQLASRFAAQHVMYAYYKSDEPDLGLRLRQAIGEANLKLFEYARRQPELVKLSTTLVAAAIRGEALHVASVGDSRAYLIRDGSLQQITRDHTLVQQLFEEGAITQEQMRTHPRRDTVLRMLGAEENARIDIFDLRLQPDDVLVLCSDGLPENLHDDEIERIVSSSAPRAAAEMLVQKSNDRGGKDNISVITALVRDGGPPLVTDIPHKWDGYAPSLDDQPTLAMRRPELPTQPPDETYVPVETTRIEAPIGTSLPPQAEPLPPEEPTPPPQAPVQEMPAPSYSTPVQPAPSYPAAPQPVPVQPPAQAYQPPAQGYQPPAQYQPPPGGYPIDPVTGLPPVPIQGQPGYEGPQQPGGAYAPRVYQPPGQPYYQQQRRRGIPVGWFAIAGLIAVALTVLMVVMLVNPFGWSLPFSGGGVAQTEEATQAAEEAPTEPTEAPTTPPPTAEQTPTEEPLPPAPPGMVVVEGGGFMRGVSEEEAQAAALSCVNEAEDNTRCFPDYFADAQPVEEVRLSPFYIDVTEITNLDYASCVAAEACSPPSDEQFYADPAFAQHPVVYVSWQQAVDYCSWAGKRLPTEAEWEKAARWDPATGQSFIYPWGNEWEPGRANTTSAGLGGTSAVQAFAQDISPTGVLDMTGNVSEWVRDWYFPGYEQLGTLNPTGPDAQPLAEPFRVVRGGSFSEDLSAYSRAGHRLAVNPNQQSSWIGFRCASDVEGAAPLEGETVEETPTGEVPEETATEEATAPAEGEAVPTETETPAP